MFKLDLENAEEPEIKLPASVGSSKKQQNSKKYSNYHITAFISHVIKVILKILQARLQQYLN